MLQHIQKQVNKLYQLSYDVDVAHCDPELYQACQALDKCVDKLSKICTQ